MIRRSWKYPYPVNPATPPQQYSTVHGLVGTEDGLLYVSDRLSNRLNSRTGHARDTISPPMRPRSGCGMIGHEETTTHRNAR